MFNPLQTVPESDLFWQKMIVTFQEEMQDHIRQQEKRLQVDASGVSEGDPDFFEKLMRVGPGARVFFRRYPFYVHLSFHPLFYPFVLTQLRNFIEEFLAMTDQVRAAAEIPSAQWEDEEYPHDLAEVVSQSDRPIPQRESPYFLAQQVMAAHEVRQSASGHTSLQMG